MDSETKEEYGEREDNTETGGDLLEELMTGWGRKKNKGENWGFFSGIVVGIFVTAVLFTSMNWLPVLMGHSYAFTSSSRRLKLQTLEAIISEDYLYDVDEDTLADGAYAGLVASLQDPYSVYYTAEEYKTINTYTQGTYSGLGIVMGLREDGAVEIREVYGDSPAEEAGLLPGDLIRSMDGESCEGMSLAEIAAYVRQGGKESVQLGIEREGEEDLLMLTVSIRSIDLHMVESGMMEDQVGYIRIMEFTGNSASQFHEAYASLRDQGMTSLVVDLRGNPGGLLTSVCDILREILPEGLIVYAEDKNGNRQEETCEGASPIDIPMAVLVNSQSASASEIFAGAVQDYGLGPVIGSVTFGKGVVQSIRVFQDGSAVKLTNSHYYTPLGHDIHGTGVQPDIAVSEVEGADAPLQAALDYFERSPESRS